MNEREACCQVEENLVPEETGKPDLTMKRCKVCQRRHFELALDPGKLGLIFK